MVGTPDESSSRAVTFCVEVIVTPGSLSGPLACRAASIAGEESCSHAVGSTMSAPACAVSLGVGVEVAGDADGDAERLAVGEALETGSGRHPARARHITAATPKPAAARSTAERCEEVGDMEPPGTWRGAIRTGLLPARDALLPHGERGGIVGHDTVHAERGDLIPLRVAVERVDDHTDAGRVELRPPLRVARERPADPRSTRARPPRSRRGRHRAGGAGG